MADRFDKFTPRLPGDALMCDLENGGDDIYTDMLVIITSADGLHYSEHVHVRGFLGTEEYLKVVRFVVAHHGIERTRSIFVSTT